MIKSDGKTGPRDGTSCYKAKTMAAELGLFCRELPCYVPIVQIMAGGRVIMLRRMTNYQQAIKWLKWIKGMVDSSHPEIASES